MKLTEIALLRVVPKPSPSMLLQAQKCDLVQACADTPAGEVTEEIRDYAHLRAVQRRMMLIDVISVTRDEQLGNAFAQALGAP